MSVGSLNSGASAMLPWPELREVRRRRIGRVEVGGGAGRWEQHQRGQELEQLALAGSRQRSEGVPGLLRLAAVAEDHLAQVDAAAVVAVGRRRGHAPQRLGHELAAQRAVEVALPEARAEVVALEVGEDATHREALPGRALQRRMSGIVVDRAQPRARRGEQAIEAALLRVVSGLDVGDALIDVDAVIRHVAGGATGLLEQAAALSRGGRIGLVAPGLEVVEEIEFEVVDERRVDLVDHAVVVAVLARAGDRRRSELVQRAIEHHARRRHHALAAAGRQQIGIGRFEPHLVVQRDRRRTGGSRTPSLRQRTA